MYANRNDIIPETVISFKETIAETMGEDSSSYAEKVPVAQGPAAPAPEPEAEPVPAADEPAAVEPAAPAAEPVEAAPDKEGL